MAMLAGVGTANAQLPGDLDIGFDPGESANNMILRAVEQPDGKIIIVGHFSSYKGVPRNRIARLHSDGSLDMSFDPGSGVIGYNDYIGRAVLVPGSGKILISGDFTSFNGVPRNRIARLHPDGSLDTTFDPGAGADRHINAIAVQADGRILIGGYFSNYNGVPRNYLARLNTDGSLDTSFDPGLGPENGVFNIAALSNGKILISGGFTSYRRISRNKIAQLHADGTLDESFDPGTGAGGGDWSMDQRAVNDITVLTLLANGKVMIGGDFSSYNGVMRNQIARLHPDGSLDLDFDPGNGAGFRVNAIAEQPNGNLIIAGYINWENVVRHHIAQVDDKGNLDQNFTSGSGSNTFITSAILLKENNSILVTGNFTTFHGEERKYIARLKGTFIAPVKVIPTITFKNLTKTYSPEPFYIKAVSNSTGEFSYEVSEKNTAQFPGDVLVASNGQVFMLKAGKVKLKVKIAENANFLAGEKEMELTIDKAKAVITFGSLDQLHNGLHKPVTVTTEPIGLDITLNYNGLPMAPVNPGSYKIKAIVQNDNYEGEAAAVLEVRTLHGAENKNIAAIYPNPTQGKSLLEILPGTEAEVTVTDMAGMILLQENVSKFKELSLEGHKPGVYLVKVQAAGEVPVVFRLIKK